MQLKLADAAFRGALGGSTGHLEFEVSWQPIAMDLGLPSGRWGVWGDLGSVQAELDAADLKYVALETFEDGLDSAIEGIVCVWSSPEVSWESVSELSEQALSQLQVFDGSKPWVWVTRDAVAAEDNDAVSGLAASALWGLARTARNENPDWQFSLVDGHVGLAKVLAHGEEPELALRGDVMLAPRLVRTQHDRLEFPQGILAHWHFAKGSIGCALGGNHRSCAS